MVKMVGFIRVFYHNFFKVQKKSNLAFKVCLFPIHTSIPSPYGLQSVH